MKKWPFGRRDRRTVNPTGDVKVFDEKTAASKTIPPVLPRKSSKRDRARDGKGKSKKPQTQASTPREEEILSEAITDPTPEYSSDREVSAAIDMAPSGDSAARQRNDTRDAAPAYFEYNHESHESLPRRPVWDEPPTLKPKINESDSFARRKSSRRVKKDPERESEIKHMSASAPPIPPLPKRPLTYSGGPLERDTKRISGGLNRRLERPLSDISLPLADSVRSSMSADPDKAPLRISSFGVLSPKPTIRYSQNPRLNKESEPSRHSSKRGKVPPDIPEETLKQSKRVDDLADDLDAAELRELMARDARRKEKKRKSDRERAQRRLERRAARQRAEEEKAAQKGEVPPVSPDRGVLGRETQGLGIEDSADNSERRHPNLGRRSLSRKSSQKSKRRRSLSADSSKRKEDIVFPELLSRHTRKEPETGSKLTTTDTRLSQSSLSPPHSPLHSRVQSNASPVPGSFRHDTPDISEYSETDDNKAVTYSWAGFFRRSLTSKTKRSSQRESIDTGRSTPSEFSTSRDSLPKGQLRPVPVYRTTRRSGAGPIRSTSLFKEDLPELRDREDAKPLADEPTLLRPTTSRSEKGTLGGGVEKSSIAATSAAESHDIFADAVSQRQSTDLGSNDGAHDLPPAATGGPAVAQSLASIDSEGSWLSGTPAARSGANSKSRTSPVSMAAAVTHPTLHGSSSSLQRTLEGEASEHEYEYSTPPSGLLDPPSVKPGFDQDDAFGPSAATTPKAEQKIWHRETVGRQPTVVYRDEGGRVKSREGLLNEFRQQGEEEDEEPDTPPGQQSSGLQRATSIELGQKHARHMSAGSAKLFDVKRSSTATAVQDVKGEE